jgi:hypothetical protein
MKTIFSARLKTKHLKDQLALNVGKPFLRKKIKVQLDHRTVIMINRLSSLNVWKKLFPKAHIIK